MQQVFRKARDGDSRATREVVDALRSRIVSMARYYARRCGEDPDDLQQVAWVGLLEALPQLDLGIGSPDQYLLQRARWRLLDDIKRSYVRRSVSLDDEPQSANSGSVNDQAMSSACVADFLGQLNDVQRVVVGHLSSGKTWRETGSAMGCSSANIAYHVRQIRRRYDDWNVGNGRRGKSSDLETETAVSSRLPGAHVVSIKVQKAHRQNRVFGKEAAKTKNENCASGAGRL